MKRGFRWTSLPVKPVKMDVSVSVSFCQDELASTIEHAVKAAVDTVLCAISKVVGSKFSEFQVEMSGKEKEIQSLKLRLEISENELKAARRCINAAETGIKQSCLFQDPKESHAVPESEAQEGPKIETVSHEEETFDQECCARLMQVTELAFVKDEEVPRLECVSVKEEFIEQECVPIAEELPNDNNVCTFDENYKLGSNLCGDSSSKCELGFRASKVDEGEHDSTPSPQCKKYRKTTPQEEYVKTLKTHSVKIPSLQDRHLLIVESTETPHSACSNSSETQGNLKTLPHSVKASKVDEGEHESTPSLQCKNSSSGKPHCKKHRERTPQDESVKTLRTHSVKIPSFQDRPPLSVESTETPHSACFNSSETQGNLKTLSNSVIGERSSCQLDIPETHKGNHTGGTTFSWVDCGKRFNHLSLLKRHQRINTGEKPSHIQYSYKSFTQLGNLHSHQHIHIEDKPYHCSVCGKRFNHSGNLKIHQRIHTGEKPYHCSLCGKRFSQVGDLKKHKRIHTGEKPYHCDVCGKRFSQLGNLKRHHKIHTGG